MPGVIPKPSEFYLRAPLYKRAILWTFGVAVPGSFAASAAFWLCYAVPKQRKYVEFYKNYDPYVHMKEICDYPIQYMQACPESIKRRVTLQMREDGKSDEEIAEFWRNRELSPSYEDILDEVKEDEIPVQKYPPPANVFFLSWFVPWYRSPSQIPDDFKA